MEIGDPAQPFTYEIAGIEVQDFAYPSWFRAGASGPYSHTGGITAPFQVPSGGYAQYIQLPSNATWKQVGLDKFDGGNDAERGALRAP
jgi:hypothetical protein